MLISFIFLSVFLIYKICNNEKSNFTDKMQYLDTFDNYYELNEKRTIGSWMQGLKKVQKDLKLNLFFISTFGIVIKGV
jgi:hypothetical protein